MGSNDFVSIVETLIIWVAISAMVLGGVVPYIPQYRKIWRSKDAQGFSTFVCLVLLIANILRILFWYVKRFEWPLLVQSVIMIVAMLMLLHLCVHVDHEKEKTITVTHRRFLDFNLQHFWNWTQFRDYCQFILCISVLGFAATYLLKKVTVFIELLGFASLMTEAMLGVPQFWKNFQNKSVQGMSFMMIVCWTSGDLFKTGYFLLREAPMQFWMCGTIQVMVDVAILIQIFMYRNHQPPTPSHHGTFFNKISVT